MNIIEKIGYSYVRFFVNPQRKRKAVNFKDSLSKAASILVIPRADQTREDKESLKKQFSDLFPEKRIDIFTPDEDLLISGKQRTYQYTSNIKDILQSQTIKNTAGSGFDVLIDLDMDFNLPAIYLTRKLNPEVCICLDKPYTKPFYNLNFNGVKKSSYENIISELCKFLKGFMN
ncbi:hypothetical protein J7K93_03900 [bacterium]|nr:hypothetical protein [bacterium]